ncbi:MAG: ATP-binding protein, partial [Planctomycetes bacterium]|nr:ATP-binding protein [Planctomycetota bacterium]
LKQISCQQHSDSWFCLSTFSDISALEQFQRYFTMLYSTNLSEEDNRTLYLAINEVCINAIEWGNKKDIDKNIQIHYKFTPEKVLLRVVDEGQGFDPSIVPNPMELGPLEIVKIRKKRGKRLGGYGLALVGKIMDKLEFRGIGNDIYMEKHLEYTDKKRTIK